MNSTRLEAGGRALGTVTWPELAADASARLAADASAHLAADASARLAAEVTSTSDARAVRVEVRWIIEEVTGARWPSSDLGRAKVSDKALDRFWALVDRRAGGEPLQYVLGHWPFRNLDLMVDRRVLIPRPETEQVVEVALSELDHLTAGRTSVAVDLGTGSGAIALSMAAERQAVQVWATDADPQALEVATANLAGMAGFAATRVRMAQGHWWAALPADLQHRIDLVVSNPPYVASHEMGTLDREVADWEPRHALESGVSGLEAVAEILGPARRDWLTPHGSAVLEIAPHQSDAARAIARRSGFTDVEVRPDLAGRPRTLVARP